MEITEKIFKQIPNGTIFGVGVIPNQPDGLYMTNENVGELLLWVAVKGYGDDWCIYCGWLNEISIEGVRKNGEKVHDINHIKKCIDCTEDILAKYRE
jgi:hypothetical protein